MKVKRCVNYISLTNEHGSMKTADESHFKLPLQKLHYYPYRVNLRLHPCWLAPFHAFFVSYHFGSYQLRDLIQCDKVHIFFARKKNNHKDFRTRTIFFQLQQIERGRQEFSYKFDKFHTDFKNFNKCFDSGSEFHTRAFL